jgi:hypothetical protein
MIDTVCKHVIAKLKINKFVETGTYKGETLSQVSMWFSKLHPEFGKIKKMSIHWKTYMVYPIFKDSLSNSNYKMYSVEFNPDFYRNAKAVFASNPNIILKNQSSQRFLQESIDSGVLSRDDRCFFFLDAHWEEYWPLRDELTQILKLPRFVVAIDDFAVPGHPEFSFDSYKNIACNWDYVKDLFKDKDVSVYYPFKPNRNLRGWVLIISGYSDKELTFLNDLPLSTKPDSIKSFKSKNSLRSIVLQSPVLTRIARFSLVIISYFKR